MGRGCPGRQGGLIISGIAQSTNHSNGINNITLTFTIIPITWYHWFFKCLLYKGNFALHRALQFLSKNNLNTQDDDMAIFIASSRRLSLPKWGKFVAITHSSMTRIEIWIHCQFVSYNTGMKLIFLQIKSLITNCYIIKIAISRYGKMNEIQ